MAIDLLILKTLLTNEYIHLYNKLILESVE